MDLTERHIKVFEVQLTGNWTFVSSVNKKEHSVWKSFPLQCFSKKDDSITIFGKPYEFSVAHSHQQSHLPNSESLPSRPQITNRCTYRNPNVSEECHLELKQFAFEHAGELQALPTRIERDSIDAKDIAPRRNTDRCKVVLVHRYSRP